MTQLTLISTSRRPLKPLAEAALANELRLLETGIERTKRRLAGLETRHGMATEEFIRKFEANELEETLETAQWVGEQRLLVRLQEKADALREIEFAN